MRNLLRVLGAGFVPSTVKLIDTASSSLDAQITRFEAGQLLEALMIKLLDDLPLRLDFERRLTDSASLPLGAGRLRRRLVHTRQTVLVLLLFLGLLRRGKVGCGKQHALFGVLLRDGLLLLVPLVEVATLRVNVLLASDLLVDAFKPEVILLLDKERASGCDLRLLLACDALLVECGRHLGG